jgi:hypothetical protein
VDLSGLIFVALAVAWAAYLIPKALRHHDDVERSRSIDRFSHGMRVLARREPVSARKARLVETHTRTASISVTRASPPADAPATPALPSADEQYAVRRAATHKATRRRRRVLAVLLLAIVGVLGAAATGHAAWTYVAAPAALLVVWLVVCRLMVRQEHAWEPVAETYAAPTSGPVVETTGAPARTDDAKDTAGDRDPGLWDPVPVTLPTYVSKPPARRAVRTIDLDATGVWTSGRSESDSALAREADAAQAADRVRRRATRKDETGEEAVGS